MSEHLLNVVEETSASFTSVLHRLAHRGADDLEAVEPTVRDILHSVRHEGDAAVVRWTETLDGYRPEPLLQRSFDGAGALQRIDPAVAHALQIAAERIDVFHQHQRDVGFRYEQDGIALGQRVRPVRCAGIYAPGGKARYPSSVLMGAIPARVAGVPDILLATPRVDDLLLAAAHLAGVTGIVNAGGAQAIGALAYGTATVPRVEKIVGPGNLYVTCAKKLVVGHVSIDGIAGPSEILVVADASASAALVAADLLSQAEHDQAAYPLLLTSHAPLVEEVNAELQRQLPQLPKHAIARAALAAHGYALVVSSKARLFAIADELAVEHVALHMEDPDAAFDAIPNMGAAFVGAATPEAAGDYLAGPSHVLPTGGAVRFGSPLGVYDFLARTSYIRYTPAALRQQAGAITTLARAEGLEAHARAVEARLVEPSRS